MTDFAASLAELIRGRDRPNADAPGAAKKNYTEALSHEISRILAGTLNELGLEHARAPSGNRDKSFMGGYGTKGVDVYLSDERHGLLLTSGVKGLVFDPRKNLKNRYRDMVLELAPARIPESLHAATYPQRLVDAFNRRNPFYWRPSTTRSGRRRFSPRSTTRNWIVCCSARRRCASRPGRRCSAGTSRRRAFISCEMGGCGCSGWGRTPVRRSSS
jgi:hypothetical protein